MSTQALDLKPIENKLAILKAKADAIQVTDAEGYALACQIAVEVRAEVKAIGFALDPGIESARRHLDELRNQKKTFTDRLTPIIDMATRKAEFWKSEERKKAQAEEDRINAERRRVAAEAAEVERKQREAAAEEDRKQREKELRAAQKAGEISKREAERLKKEATAQEVDARVKAAEDAQIAAANVQIVKVAPSVPKVAGIRARVNWKFEVKIANLIPRQYTQPNLVAIGEMVRRTKDKAKAENECPGIEVSQEDSV